MAYQILKSDGTAIIVDDSSVNTKYSVALVGKNETNYGVPLNQNFFRLMENFANGTPPSLPQRGQLWWDTNGTILNVFTGVAWKPISSTLASQTSPANPVTGDLWFDTVNQQLKVWNVTTWTVVGPTGSAFSGQNGFVTEKIIVGAVSYYVASMYAGGLRVAILSKDLITNTGLTDFPTIHVGITYSGLMNTNLVGAYNGDLGGNLVTANYGNITHLTNDDIFSNTGHFNSLLATIGNIAALTATDLTVLGNLSVSGASTFGSMTIGNITLSGNLAANNFSTNNAAISGNLTAGNLTVSGKTALGVVGNVSILGGTAGQVLSTDGTGNLTWANGGVGGGGSGTVTSGLLGALTYYAANGTTVTATNTANLSWNDIANYLTVSNITTTGVLNVTGNITAGNVGATKGTFATLSVSGNANVGNIGSVGGSFTGAVSVGTTFTAAGKVSGSSSSYRLVIPVGTNFYAT